MRSATQSLLALLVLVVAAAGQDQVSVTTSGVQPARVKLGSTAHIKLTVKGTQEARLLPLPEVAGLRLAAGGPSQRSYVSYSGRRVVREISITYTVVITPLRKGTFRIPPLTLEAGGRKWNTEPATLEVVEDFLGREYGLLEVKASQRLAWVHQPIRVTATIGLDRSIVERIQGFSINMPWVERLPGATIIESKSTSGQTIDLVVNDKKFQGRNLGYAKRGGKDYLLLAVSRDFLPTRTGELELPEGFVTFKLVTRYGRSVFGDRVPVETTTCTIPGKSMRIRVKAFPEKGRPADYTGAVGQFQVSATAAPTDVQVGESIKLTLNIQGQGNLGFFPTPETKELEGFRVFGKTEERIGDLLKVTYDIAPVEDRVREIPPLAFSYFDTTADREGYRVKRTRPIKIRVRPLPEGAGLQQLKGPKKTVVPGVDDIVGLKEFDPEEPLVAPDRVDPTLLVLGLGLPPLGWLALVMYLRRQRQLRADPLGRRRRRALAQVRAALAGPVDAAGLDRAHYTFLGDLWGASAAAMQGGGWREAARRADLAAELVDRLAAVEEGLERSRFTPAGSGGDERLKQEILALARELDGAGGVK